MNELIRGHRAITADTALRLGIFFDNDAAFWMHLQVAWDMHAAAKKLRAGRKRIVERSARALAGRSNCLT